jgi:DNA mismatch endonuclease (patch repair protein)
VRPKGTQAEIDLRKVLHAQGLRYCLHATLLTKPRRVSEIGFFSAMLAVFVDGGFWHGCLGHASWPKSSADFWREKIETNRSRDADTDQRLNALGWETVQVWEHQDASKAANRITELVDTRKRNGAIYVDDCR